MKLRHSKFAQKDPLCHTLWYFLSIRLSAKLTLSSFTPIVEQFQICNPFSPERSVVGWAREPVHGKNFVYLVTYFMLCYF